MKKKQNELEKRTESLSLENLKSAPYNPRRIDKRNKKALAESINKFGDISGIVWNKRTGHIVCGHQRVEVLKQKYPDLKIENDVIIADDKIFPIRIVDWDLETEKLANISANSQYMSGEFDYVKLDEIIQELAPLNMEDMKLLRIDEIIPDTLSQEELDDIKYKEHYEVIIECENEKEQQDLLARFIKEKLKCRALTS